MKKGKKWLALFLVMALCVITLAACGGGKAETSKPAEAPSKAEEVVSLPDEPIPGPTEPEEEEDPYAFFYDNMDEGYLGQDTSGNDVVWMAGPVYAVLAFVSPDGESASFVGELVDHGDGTASIADTSSGLEITFGVVLLDDGSVMLDIGDLGEIYLEPSDVDTAVDALMLIDAFGTAVA